MPKWIVGYKKLKKLRMNMILQSIKVLHYEPLSKAYFYWHQDKNIAFLCSIYMRIDTLDQVNQIIGVDESYSLIHRYKYKCMILTF